MPSSRLKVFLLLSLILHAAVLTLVAALTPDKAYDLPQPLAIGVTTRYNDPGRGKGNSLEPAPMKQPEARKKAEKAHEKKTVMVVTKRTPPEKTEKKEIISRDIQPVTEQTTAAESTIPSANAVESDSVSPDGKARGSGLGDRGTGLDTKGDGRGAEIGYPDYGVNPKPNYPMIAKRHGYEGLVVLNVFVLENGNVGKIEIRKSSGYDVLDDSALNSVREWTFIPGKINGRPASSWVAVPVRFDLTNR